MNKRKEREGDYLEMGGTTKTLIMRCNLNGEISLAHFTLDSTKLM